MQRELDRGVNRDGSRPPTSSRIGRSQREAIISATDEEEVLLLVVFCALGELVENRAGYQSIKATLRVEAKVREIFFRGVRKIMRSKLCRKLWRLRRLWRSLFHKNRMLVVDGFPFVERCFELQCSVFVSALGYEEGCEFDGDSTSLSGGDEPVLSVGVFMEDGCEEAAQGLSSYRRVLIAPSSVSADVDGEVAAVARSRKGEGDFSHRWLGDRRRGGGRGLDIGSEGGRRHRIRKFYQINFLAIGSISPISLLVSVLCALSS